MTASFIMTWKEWSITSVLRRFAPSRLLPCNCGGGPGCAHNWKLQLPRNEPNFKSSRWDVLAGGSVVSATEEKAYDGKNALCLSELEKPFKSRSDRKST